MAFDGRFLKHSAPRQRYISSNECERQRATYQHHRTAVIRERVTLVNKASINPYRYKTS